MGELAISAEDVEVTGISNGSLTARDGGRFVLTGILNGDITLELGSVVDVRGTVNGSATNNGGELDVSGTIAKDLNRVSGTTRITATAIIKGAIS